MGTDIHTKWELGLSELLSYFFDEVRRLKELHGETRLVLSFDS